MPSEAAASPVAATTGTWHNTSSAIPAAEIDAPSATVRRVPSARTTELLLTRVIVASTFPTTYAPTPASTPTPTSARRYSTPHVAMPPSTIADAAKTNASTVRPSWRNPMSARNIDGWSSRGGSEICDRNVNNPITIANTATPTHTT